MTDKMWTGYPDPRHLAMYDARYQSERYDEAMRRYGETIYRYPGDLGLGARAWTGVAKVMNDVNRQKYQQFVLRSVC